MDTLRDIERTIGRLKSEAIATRAELKFRKLMHALKAGFDSGQLRDEYGRWTDGGHTGLSNTPAKISRFASYSNSAACNLQYKSDIFHCKMVGLSTCYAQAMVRLVACERGQPIPPLNY
jgi:hypothetical protein